MKIVCKNFRCTVGGLYTAIQQRQLLQTLQCEAKQCSLTKQLLHKLVHEWRSLVRSPKKQLLNLLHRWKVYSTCDIHLNVVIHRWGSHFAFVANPTYLKTQKSVLTQSSFTDPVEACKSYWNHAPHMICPLSFSTTYAASVSLFSTFHGQFYFLACQ